MSGNPTGGPAFPNATIKTKDGIDIWGEGGMTLRDYFAAKALPAVIADWVQTDDIYANSEIPEVIARDCYIVADAMLKAREQ